MFGITLNMMLDIDCFRVQTVVCSCNADATDQDTDAQADTCTHCTGWLPVFTTAGQSTISSLDLPFHGTGKYVSNTPHLERPPIFA